MVGVVRGEKAGFAVQCRSGRPERRPINRKESIVIITVTSRHMEVSPPLKTYADQKANKLLKYYDRIQEIEIIFDAGKSETNVEMIVNAEHNNMFIARAGSADAYACVDQCVDKLERQLSDHKKKYRNRKHLAEDKRDMRQAAGEGGSSE
jgi:putative sigma-54 modulation protein